MVNQPAKFSLLLVAFIVSLMAPVSFGKLASCSLRFSRKMSYDYCTKFGTTIHTSLDIDVKAKLTNHKLVTV